MYKAVVFDMDGVLLDSEKLYRRFWKKAGVEELHIPEDEMEKICDRLAGGTRRTNGNVFKEKLGQDFDYLPFRAHVMDMFEEEIRVNGVELKNGVKEILQYLKQKDIKIALATSTDKVRAEEKLVKKEIFQFFDETVYGNEIEKGKPNPDIYLKACEKLGVNPEEAIGVEDSINGVLSSRAAGLYTVMVVDLIKPNDITKEKANQIYSSISELKKLI